MNAAGRFLDLLLIKVSDPSVSFRFVFGFQSLETSHLASSKQSWSESAAFEIFIAAVGSQSRWNLDETDIEPHFERNDIFNNRSYRLYDTTWWLCHQNVFLDTGLGCTQSYYIKVGHFKKTRFASKGPGWCHNVSKLPSMNFRSILKPFVVS